MQTSLMGSMRSTTSPRGGRAQRRIAFTLVELLVVITIIGILIALLLPAVQSAREAARRMQCKNHVRQWGMAALSHEQAQGYFPGGGWGCNWVGNPDYGFGRQQPGGWIYNCLPYIEQQALHDLGKGGTAAQKRTQAVILSTTPLEMLFCPSRRPVAVYPIHPGYAPFVGVNADPTNRAVRTDYAANLGYYSDDVAPPRGSDYCKGPTNGEAVPAQADAWTGWPTWQKTRQGIMYLRSQVTMADVTDGASNTCLVGEKYLNPDFYLNGADDTDNRGSQQGEDIDHSRVTSPLATERPSQDTPGDSYPNRSFGSAHGGSFNMVFCDGAVHSISYEIDPVTFRCLGSRNDQQPILGGNF